MEKLAVRGAKVGEDYRVGNDVVRVLYIAQRNDTGEYLVAYCPFNYIEEDCKSSDTTDNVRLMPISQWRKIAHRADRT
jgi:hypothetical protein|nr:MAG TPA: hypothetical protein [Caudoviricetes sp.]